MMTLEMLQQASVKFHDVDCHFISDRLIDIKLIRIFKLTFSPSNINMCTVQSGVNVFIALLVVWNI